MPEGNHDDKAPLDRVRGDRGLAHRSGFVGKRIRELAQKAGQLQSTDDIEVVFPDKELEAAVREELENADGPLTRGDLKGIKELAVFEKAFEYLTGLEHAVNLTRLDLDRLSLGWHQIRDVSPLASLTNLARLTLVGNQISDVSPLASLTKLTYLNLAYNQISDVSPLASLTNLTTLVLENNPLSQESVDVHVPNFEDRGVTVAL